MSKTTQGNYYNEHDPKAAAWLRELIARELIPPGIVDERSIENVRPNEVMGYTQCHFFAGIGGWSRALQLADWPTDRPVWTGSCPCQPFSQAGAGAGTDDARHLWPAFRWLIDQCRPATVFGEQVASKAGRSWLDGVRTDLEALGYGVGAADLCAAGIGAPHIRQRLFWVANPESSRRGGWSDESGWGEDQRTAAWRGGQSRDGGLADARSQRRQQNPGGTPGDESADGRWAKGNNESAGNGEVSGGVGDSRIEGLERHAGNGDGEIGRTEQAGSTAPAGGIGRMGNSDSRGSPQGHCPAEANGHRGSAVANGFWDDAIWIECGDGKARRLEPGTAPLAHGIPARVVRLRGYGNAIVPQVAAAFIRASVEAQP